MMKQIHSADVFEASLSCADAFDGKGDFQPCDGIFASGEGYVDTVGVKTADCVPVLLYDVKNNVPCAVHAGWCGSVADICGNAVRAIRKKYPDAEIINVGEKDFIISYIAPGKKRPVWEYVKAALICVIIGVGAAFSIMTYPPFFLLIHLLIVLFVHNPLLF